MYRREKLIWCGEGARTEGWRGCMRKVLHHPDQNTPQAPLRGQERRSQPLRDGPLRRLPYRNRFAQLIMPLNFEPIERNRGAVVDHAVAADHSESHTSPPQLACHFQACHALASSRPQAASCRSATSLPEAWRSSVSHECKVLLSARNLL